MTSGQSPAHSFGAFDTDTDALTRRIAAHARYGTREFDPWVLKLLNLSPGQRILDLGCGTGKQTLPMAEAVGGHGRIVAIDASADALAEVKSASQRRGLGERISVRQARFEELSELDGPFDRIVSCYALYYAVDAGPLFALFAAALRESGLLFFCGPSRRNNAELLRFCADVSGEEMPDRPDPIIEFMEHTGVALARSTFDEVEELEFENPLRFDSAEAVLTYWRSYNLYDASLEAAFGAAITRHFEHEPVFETVKRVLAVRAQKPRT